MRYDLFQNLPIYFLIFRLEHIKHDSFYGCILFQIFPHGLHRDLRRFLLWKMKLSCGDTAESDTFQSVFRGQSKAGTVAVCQLPAVLFCKFP